MENYIRIIDKTKDLYININGKEVKAWNAYYKCYTAEYCKALGLPMLNNKTYDKYSNKWLSSTRCNKIKKPVTEDEYPVAFYRVKNGYIPLFERDV